MLKLLLTLECDSCGDCFEHVTTTTDGNPTNWEYLLPMLEYKAQNCSWYCQSAHYCYSCCNNQDSPSSTAFSTHPTSIDDDF
jgi:hypothetical protein